MKQQLLLTAALMLGMAQGAWAQDVQYIERSWDQTNKTLKSETKTCSKYKDFSTLSDNKGARGIGDGYGADFKWVVLKQSQSIKQLVVQGEAHLILCDGATLSCSNGVVLEAGHSLYIYSQRESDTDEAQGRLTVTRDTKNAAGIGGHEATGMGDLLVHGGIISATGSDYGAGIGHGAFDSSSKAFKSGTMRVFGGKITALGGYSGAGIGGGSGHGGDGNNGITYYQLGGDVTCTGGLYAAGLGGGGCYYRFFPDYNGTGGVIGYTYIAGGKLTATGGERAAGIGNGNCSWHEKGGELRIDGGTIVARGKVGGAGIGGGESSIGFDITINGGDIKAYGSYNPNRDNKCSPGIGGENGQKFVMTGGTVLAIGADNAPGIGGDNNGYGGDVHILGGVLLAEAGNIAPGAGADITRFNLGAIGTGIYKTNKNYGTVNDERRNLLFLGDATHFVRVRLGNGHEHPDGDLCLAADRVERIRKNPFAKIETCTHELTNAFTYTLVDDQQHEKTCKYCGYKAKENHDYHDGKCACGKEGTNPTPEVPKPANPETKTWTVTVKDAASAEDTKYDNGTQEKVVQGKKYTLPLPKTPEGYDFMGWLVDPYLVADYIISGDNEDGKLKSAGEEIDVTKDMTIYARYRYQFDQEVWQWADDRSWAKLTIKVTPRGKTYTPEVTITGPVVTQTTEDGITVKTSTYKATAKQEINGYVYEFEDESSLSEVDGITLLDNGDDVDNYAKLAEYDGMQIHNLTLQGRTLYKDGRWLPLCLPFDVDNLTGTPLEGATLMTLNGAKQEGQTLTLSFADITSVKAGQPFIAKWNSGSSIDNPVFHNVTLTAQTTDVTTDLVDFCGTYDPVTLDEENDDVLYISTQTGELMRNTGTTQHGAFRGFFVVKVEPADPTTPTPSPAPDPDDPDDDDDPEFPSVYVLDDGSQAAIREAKVTTTSQDNRWYTLDGRPLSAQPTTKGVYIRNGKKLVVR